MPTNYTINNTLIPDIPKPNIVGVNLIFDKLSFTLHINKKDRLKLIRRINDPKFHSPYKRKVYRNIPNKKGLYNNNNYLFTLTDGNAISLSLYPKSLKNNFLRLEYNPAKLGEKGRLALRAFLIALGRDVVKQIYFKARVTRLDLTVDIRGLTQDYYLHKPSVKKVQIYRKAPFQLTSQILGSENSDCRVIIYDKNEELLSRGEKSEATPYQRLEINLQKLNCSMAGLNEVLLENFNKIGFYHELFMLDARFSERFVTKCLPRRVQRGFQQNLQGQQKEVLGTI